jgi:chromosome segregation ATPase
MWQCQNKKIQEPGISIPIVSVNSAKQSDSQLQANAKSTPNLPNEVLLDNQACSKLSREQAVIHKQTLQSTIQDLRNQNQNLKIRLDKLLGSNTKGLEKLKHYYNENNKLKTELKLLSTRKLNETSESAKSQYELKTEINNLNNKLKFEQAQRDELKRRYETEISSVKIRYDNELEKQNKLMQIKNDNLVKEINKLNESIRKLQEEKSALLMKMKSDVLESAELKSSMSTSSASKVSSS